MTQKIETRHQTQGTLSGPIALFRRPVTLLDVLSQAARRSVWFVLYWSYFAWLARFERRSSPNLEMVRSTGNACPISETTTAGVDPTENDERERRIEEVMRLASRPLSLSESVLRETLGRLVDLGVDRHDLNLIAKYVPIKGSILDVGCGNCWYAPFLLASGATSYYGIDREIDFDSKALTDYFGGEMPMSIGEFLGCFPAIRYERCDVLEFNPGIQFDVAVMLTVSEHLEDPDRAFQKVSELIKCDGLVYVSHENFYSWNGHHSIPQTVDQYDPEVPAMRQLADWNHVLNRHLLDGKKLALNFIRIHDLLDILDRYFVIEKVDKVYSTPEKGGERMTPEIHAKLLKYHYDELLVEMFEIVCRKAKKQAEIVEPGDVVPLAVAAPGQRRGKCWLVPLPLGVNAAEFELYEDESRLGPARSRHDEIRELGQGRYSIWSPLLYLSTSDDTNPSTNGRTYTLRRIVHDPGRGAGGVNS